MSATGLTFRQRLELRFSRLIPLIAPKVQVRLSGSPPVQRDGQTLAPDLQLMLSAVEKRGRPPYEELSLAEARAEMRSGAIVAGGKPDLRVTTEELTIDGGAGPLRARLYRRPPEGGAETPPPLIVFLHGGGFVLGDLDSHDVPCRLLARHAGAHVLAVDYRMAPEHPFPAPVEDALAALRWGHANAARLGADPGAVAIGGDSAGGNLAAVATWLAVREGVAPPPALQLLIYPATEFVEHSHSARSLDEGFLLTRRDMDWFADRYTGAADRADPRISISRAEDLSGMPPALVVTAGFDPLRDEGETFAHRLRAAGVTVVQRRFPDLIHGFINLTGISRASQDAVVEMAGITRALLTSATGEAPAVEASTAAEAVA